MYQELFQLPLHLAIRKECFLEGTTLEAGCQASFLVVVHAGKRWGRGEKKIQATMLREELRCSDCCYLLVIHANSVVTVNVALLHHLVSAAQDFEDASTIPWKRLDGVVQLDTVQLSVVVAIKISASAFDNVLTVWTTIVRLGFRNRRFGILDDHFCFFRRSTTTKALPVLSNLTLSCLVMVLLRRRRRDHGQEGNGQEQ